MSAACPGRCCALSAAEPRPRRHRHAHPASPPIALPDWITRPVPGETVRRTSTCAVPARRAATASNGRRIAGDPAGTARPQATAAAAGSGTRGAAGGGEPAAGGNGRGVGAERARRAGGERAGPAGAGRVRRGVRPGQPGGAGDLRHRRRTAGGRPDRPAGDHRGRGAGGRLQEQPTPAGRAWPRCPRAYLRQLAAYRALLRQLYPGRRVRAAPAVDRGAAARSRSRTSCSTATPPDAALTPPDRRHLLSLVSSTARTRSRAAAETAHGPEPDLRHRLRAGRAQVRARPCWSTSGPSGAARAR